MKMRPTEDISFSKAKGPARPDSWIIDPVVTTTKITKTGRRITNTAPLNKTQQVEKCGNSVSPPLACAIIQAVAMAIPKAIAA